MHTHVDRPDLVTAAELDRYLERGWYRVGQVLMTCRFVLNDTGLRSAVWTRVPLHGYAFKRSHRKLLAAIDRSFRLVEGPAVPDATREEVYRRYLTIAKGERSENLGEFLGHGWEGRYATRELAMWQGDRLIGFSWYDLGAASLQSLIAVYDPDFRRMSLGFTTLLLEIREALRLGLQYHYSGYVLPGDPTMDYKLRTRPIEYLDPRTGAWRPWEEIDLGALPAEQVKERLAEAELALAEAGIPVQAVEYAPYGLRSERLPQLFGEPLALDLDLARDPRGMRAITWDLDRGAYRVQKCARAWAQRVGADGHELDPVHVWVITHDLAVAESAADLVRRLRR